jgi:hypothetical protein
MKSAHLIGFAAAALLACAAPSWPQNRRNRKLDGRAEPVNGMPNGNRGQADKKHRGGGAMRNGSGSCTDIQMR